MYIYSPLEQYKIVYFTSKRVCFLDLSITFYLVLFCLIFFFLFTFFYLFFFNSKTSYILPNHFFYNFENFCSFIYTLTKNILPTQGLKFFPLILLVFLFVTLCNTLGLIPYSYTITSQLYITGILSITIFFGVLWNGLRLNGFKFFSLFLPPNTSVLLSFLIIPIEIISYFFRPISLAVRLFANMMAGHALLKVIISFAWKLVLIGSLMHSFAVGLLVLLFFLEFCVACIQAYVFTMLLILYINELYNLH